MLLTKWNRPAAVALAGAVGLAVVVFAPAGRAHRHADAAENVRSTQPGAVPQQPEDKEKQAKKTLEAAETRLKEAQDQLRAAQENYNKAKAAQNAVAWVITLRPLQSLNWFLVEASATKQTISVKSTDHHGLRPGQRVDSLSLTLFLAKDVQVFIDGQEGSVKDLGQGMQVSLRLAENQPEVIRIDATSTKRTQEQVLKEVDVAKKTISVTIGEKVTLEKLPVERAAVEIETRDDSELEDLKPGMHVSLELSIKDGQIAVRRIVARK